MENPPLPVCGQITLEKTVQQKVENDQRLSFVSAYLCDLKHTHVRAHTLTHWIFYPNIAFRFEEGFNYYF